MNIKNLAFILGVLVITTPNVKAMILDSTNITEVTTHIMDGSGLDGMNISVAFSDNTVSTGVWDGNSLSAMLDNNSHDWSLSFDELTGDTINGAWTFASGSHTVKSFKLTTFTANSVFDNLKAPDIGTTGSEVGKYTIILDDVLFDNTQYNETFSGAVKLNGVLEADDLYTMLMLDTFQGDKATNGLLNSGQHIMFIADTDAVEFAPIPVPPAAFLFVSSLFGLICFKRLRIL